ncbi:unnamed protein product [marine sediment metagenome]|uniref:Uncharacterized protein n=3 Tax=marine sediment metagenome TaxID=412755 RepID=X1RKT5_9ZZZZ
MRAADEIKGPLPCCDATYNQIKKGHLDWPTVHRVFEFFGSMARAWLAAGVQRDRVSLKNIDWTPEEETYLKEKAGIMTLVEIGFNLRRSYDAVRARLNKELKITARGNQGLFSAAELSKEYGCPYHRVRQALIDGRIPGRFDSRRNRWQVDLGSLTPAAEAILEAPKLHSYKNSPSDFGDYYRRHKLRRTLIEGRVIVVAANI